MKVVLFCGGLGTRLKEFSETIPKPMVEIGYRPLMWHLMRYYAHFGHKEFILCLGYRGDYIKKYFLNYDEWLSNDFVMQKGGKHVQLHNNDIEDWTISFIDTGLHTNIGQRLLAVKEYLDGEEVFMANYSDGLADLDIHRYLDYFNQQNKIASFLSVNLLNRSTLSPLVRMAWSPILHQLPIPICGSTAAFLYSRKRSLIIYKKVKNSFKNRFTGLSRRTS